MYITITQAASLLGQSYSTTRDTLTRAKVLDFDGTSARVLVERFERLFGIPVPAAWFRKEKRNLVTLRILVKMLPLFGDLVKTREELKACIKYGKYFSRWVNHCERYVMEQFLNPNSWASEEEKKHFELHQQGFELHGRYAEVLREERLGVKRALGIVTPESFEAFKADLEARMKELGYAKGS